MPGHSPREWPLARRCGVPANEVAEMGVSIRLGAENGVKPRACGRPPLLVVQAVAPAVAAARHPRWRQARHALPGPAVSAVTGSVARAFPWRGTVKGRFRTAAELGVGAARPTRGSAGQGHTAAYGGDGIRTGLAGRAAARPGCVGWAQQPRGTVGSGGAFCLQAPMACGLRAVLLAYGLDAGVFLRAWRWSLSLSATAARPIALGLSGPQVLS